MVMVKVAEMPVMSQPDRAIPQRVEMVGDSRVVHKIPSCGGGVVMWWRCRGEGGGGGGGGGSGGGRIILSFRVCGARGDIERSGRYALLCTLLLLLLLLLLVLLFCIQHFLKVGRSQDNIIKPELGGSNGRRRGTFSCRGVG